MPARKSALHTLELQLREAQELAHFGSWEWDVREERVTWSQPLYAMMGVDPATFQPSAAAFFECVHPEDRERVMRAAAEQRANGTPYTAPIRIVRPDGGVRTIRGSSHAVRDAAGRVVRVVGVLQDISDEVAAQEALRSYAAQVVVLARRLVEVQESQGQTLARELHDNLGPSLTALGINLQLIVDALPAELREKLGATLEDSREQVRQASAAMRDVMGELRPHALDDHGLPAALRVLAGAFEKRTSIRAKVSVIGRERAADRVALPLYRIAQEALNNVAKHSRARNVELRYVASDAGVLLEIQDDGVGLAGSDTAESSGFGLATMRERAAAAGASCEVLSRSGGGVLVRVAISSL